MKIIKDGKTISLTIPIISKKLIFSIGLAFPTWHNWDSSYILFGSTLNIHKTAVAVSFYVFPMKLTFFWIKGDI